MKFLMAAIAALFFASLANPANAMSKQRTQAKMVPQQSVEFSARRHHHHRHHYDRWAAPNYRAGYITQQPANIIVCNQSGCQGSLKATLTIERRVHRAKHGRERITRLDANGNSDSIIGGRPEGCPHAYCGCGLRKYLGLKDVRLNLAWNWARMFPHTHPHPGAAAVRSHHVMLLVAQISGSIWTVRDYNGGRHLSYIHERNVSGYVFVEPSAGRFAANSNL